MKSVILNESLATLGFPELTPVSSLLSIAHLFGTSRNRCGVYFLAFCSELFYIGQSVDVVKRFAQHRRVHDDIVGFSFIPLPKSKLDNVERAMIFQVESLGFRITNAVHVTNITGDTDLDLIISPSEQEDWIDDPLTFNSAQTDSDLPRILLPETQQARFFKHYSRFKKHPLNKRALSLLKQYIWHCIPMPRRTEYSFWSVSCMPSTNLTTWPRLLCVNAAVMELFVVGAEKQNAESLWSFVNVAEDTLLEHWHSLKNLTKAFPFVRVIHSGYRDAGQHQVTLHTYDDAPMEQLLTDPGVCKAAATLSLRVMRKRATIYGKYHCVQLANQVFTADEEVS